MIRLEITITSDITNIQDLLDFYRTLAHAIPLYDIKNREIWVEHSHILYDIVSSFEAAMYFMENENVSTRQTLQHIVRDMEKLVENATTNDNVYSIKILNECVKNCRKLNKHYKNYEI